MTTEYMRQLGAKIDADAARAAEKKALHKLTFKRLADHRSATFLKDGRRALAMRQAGRSPTDILLTIGGSRARMYKALHAALDEAAETSIDPLLS